MLGRCDKDSSRLLSLTFSIPASEKLKSSGLGRFGYIGVYSKAGVETVLKFDGPAQNDGKASKGAPARYIIIPERGFMGVFGGGVLPVL